MVRVRFSKGGGLLIIMNFGRARLNEYSLEHQELRYIIDW